MIQPVKPLKIAFIGATCVGKTTLLNRTRLLVGSNLKVTFVDEVARSFFLQNPVPAKFSAETQGKIQSMVLKQEHDAYETGAQIIFCDRSVIDAVVYVRANGNIRGAEQLLERVRFWLPTYDQLFILDPADVPYQNDSIREENDYKRQKCHDSFLDLLQEIKVDFELLSGSIEDRTSRIEQIYRYFVDKGILRLRERSSSLFLKHPNLGPDSIQ